MPRVGPRRSYLGAALAPLLGVAVLAAPPASHAPAPRLRLVRVMPPAHEPGVHITAGLPASARIEGAVGLRPRDEAGLSSFVTAVTTAGNPMFHHYLAEGAFLRRFGPSRTAVRRLRAELVSHGLTVRYVSANRLLVAFSGSASAVEAAFHTHIDDVVLPDGARGRATVAGVRLPSAVARDVTVVTGLDDLVRARAEGPMPGPSRSPRAPARARAPRPAPGAPHACPAAAATADGLGGLTDSEIASSYGAFGLYRDGDIGSGQAIAVFELEPFARSDIHEFDRCYFGSKGAAAMMGRLRVHRVDGGQPVGPGSGEAVLDVENLSAMAPGAHIDVYEAPNTNTGSLEEYDAIVSSDADDVVTTSWGLCETAIQQGSPGTQQEEHFIFEEAAAQGQTVFAASGDSGADDCNTFETPMAVRPLLSVDDPGSQPYVVSAGGATIYTASQPPRESVWDDGPSGGGGGGGISNSWLMPSWQASSRVRGLAPGGTVAAAERLEGDRFCAGNGDGSTFGGTIGQPCREVPDVSADADEYTGAVTVYSAAGGGWSTVGGTSSAAPIWAAMLALVNASPFCSSESVAFAGGRLHDAGFASPLLYQVASSPTAYAASFTDLRAGSNDVYGLSGDQLFKATPGYDMASGLGSPQLTAPGGRDGLAYYLCSYGAPQKRPAVSGLRPDALSATAVGTTLVVTGSGFSDGGRSFVEHVSVGNFLVPSVDVTVDGPRRLTLLHLPSGRDLLPTGGTGDGAGAATVTVSLHGGATSAPVPASRLEIVDSRGDSVLPAVSGVSSSAGPDRGGNTVTVFGSGFHGVSSVAFGGVETSKFNIRSDVELTATVPAWSAATRCATSLSPTADVCQVEVVVRTSSGTSSVAVIRQPYAGTVGFNDNGVVTAPSGCGCEVAPALSEYDYFPPPRITSVSTARGPLSYASENGDSTVTVGGTGLGDLLGTIGVPVGPASDYNSWSSVLSYDSPGELQVLLPAQAPTVGAFSVPLRVVTAGGTSRPAGITYAGIPSVFAVHPVAFPATGGHRGTLRGIGLGDTAYLMFVNSDSSDGTVSYFRRAQRSLSFISPQENPGKVSVLACTASGCGNSSRRDSVWLYPPGNPRLSGLRPRFAKAHGGAKVLIHGKNLSCAIAVYFGKYKASFINSPTLLECGSATTIIATAPPGQAGRSVPITVETVESKAVRFGRTRITRAGRFGYLTSSPSPPRGELLVPGHASLLVRWRSPLSNGGARITTYVVRARARGLPSRVKVITGHSRSWRFSGLYPGAIWTVSVTAHNRFGAGLTARASAEPFAARRPKRH